MTTISGKRRIGSIPPWLWVWMLLFLFYVLPDYFGGTLRAYSSDDFVRSLFSNLPFIGKALWVTTQVIDLAPTLILATGLATVILPWLRAAYLEQRFNLAQPSRVSPALEEISSFIKDHAPSIAIKTNTRRYDQLCFVYPLSYRRTAIAVFGGLAKLWRSDREAAEAALLHEVAHYCYGDSLIVGAGSFFEWSVRRGLFLTFLVFLVFQIYSDVTTVGLNNLAASEAVVTLGYRILISVLLSFCLALLTALYYFSLPIIGIWCAEFNADRFASQFAESSGGVGRALEKLADPISWWRWLLFRLSHPPNRIRQWMVSHSASLAGLVVVLLFYPLTYVLELLVGLGATLFRNFAWNWQSFIARAAGRTTGVEYTDTWVNILSSIKEGLAQIVAPWFFMAALLLLWPFLERYWQRFFSRERGRFFGRPDYGGYFLSGLIVVALAGLLYSTGPAIPIPDPKPAEIPGKGGLPPDQYITGKFEPTLTFSVGNGWYTWGETSSNFFIYDKNGNYMIFEHVEGIFDPNSSEVKLENVRYPPDDQGKAYWLTGELIKHPELTFQDRVLQLVRVGGTRGIQLTVEVSSNSATDYPSSCQDPCLPLFLNSGNAPHFFDQGRTYRIIVLEVHGELIAITVGNLPVTGSANEPTDSASELNQFWPKAEGVLATVEWKD
jgi:Zn-dependent protease with chaperone function